MSAFVWSCERKFNFVCNTVKICYWPCIWSTLFRIVSVSQLEVRYHIYYLVGNYKVWFTYDFFSYNWWHMLCTWN